MKSMEKYITEVYEKYNETEKKHEIYKTVKMKTHNPLNTLCYVAACFLLICIIGITHFNTNKDVKIEYAKSEVKDDGSVVYIKYLKVDGKFDETYLKRLISKSDCIAIVSNYDVAEVMPVFINGRFMVKSVGKLNIDRILFSKNVTNNEIIDYSKLCGTISLEELSKNDDIDMYDWEIMHIGKTIEEDKKSSTYFKQIPSNGCEFEEGKQYLVFMSYNEEENVYEIFDFAHGILEYDELTNKVKNTETGEFEEFAWNLINEKEN